MPDYWALVFFFRALGLLERLLLRLVAPRALLLALVFEPCERDRVRDVPAVERLVEAAFKPPLGRTVKDLFVVRRVLPARDLVFVAIKTLLLIHGILTLDLTCYRAGSPRICLGHCEAGEPFIGGFLFRQI
jgi:hypothetical protein